MFERLKAFLSDPEPAQVTMPIGEEKPMYAASFMKGLTPKVVLSVALLAQAAAAGNAFAQAPAQIDAVMQGTAIVQMVKGDQQLPAEFKEAASHFTRYVAGGNSAVEIEVIAKRGIGQSGGDHGPHASQAEEKGPGGLYSCKIDNIHTDYAARSISEHGHTFHIDTPAMRAGVFIHEYTHCQTLHHLGMDSPTDAQWEAMTPAQKHIAKQVAEVQLNASEGVSDARAVIELARKDGLGAAQEYVQKMTAVRAAADGDAVHSTSYAMNEALRIAQYEPASIKTDQAAFNKAVDLGIANAQILAKAMMREAGKNDLLAKALDSSSAQLKTSLQGAVSEFAHGPVANSHINITARGAGKMAVTAQQDGSYTATERISVKDASSLMGARLQSLLEAKAEKAELNSPTVAPRAPGLH